MTQAELRRGLIRACVEEHPGTSLRALCRLTDLAMGTVTHHVRILKGRGLLAEGRLGHLRVFYARGPVPDPGTVLLDREPALRQVLAAFQGGQRCQRDILDAFQARGWARATTQHRLSRLVRQGLVIESRAGRFVFYEPRGQLGHALPLAELATEA